MKEVFIVEENISVCEWHFLMVCDQLSVAQMEIANLYGDLARLVRVSDTLWQLVSKTETDDDGQPEIFGSYAITPRNLVTFRDPYNKSIHNPENCESCETLVRHGFPDTEQVC